MTVSTGPWIACFTTFCGKVVRFHITGPKHGSMHPICECNQEHDAETLIANANLLAAAPLLLEALQRLIVASDPEELLDDESEIWQQAHAAVERALGQ